MSQADREPAPVQVVLGGQDHRQRPDRQRQAAHRCGSQQLPAPIRGNPVLRRTHGLEITNPAGTPSGTEVLMLRIEGPPPVVNRTASRSPNSAAPQPISITRSAGSTCSSLARVGVRFDHALTGRGTATAAGR
jgi:hypothetical protein